MPTAMKKYVTGSCCVRAMPRCSWNSRIEIIDQADARFDAHLAMITRPKEKKRK